MKTLKPHQKTKRELRHRRRKILSISFLSIFIITSFIWFMNYDRFKISDIRISGNRIVLQEDIYESINTYLERKIIGVLPRNNVLLTNTKQIERNIKNTFPKIYNAKVLIKDGSKLIIEVEEREPHSLWCKDKNYESDFEEECYFADQRGFIYTRAPYFSAGVFEKIYTTNNVLQIGEQVLDKQDFDSFFDFTNTLYDDYGIGLDRVFIDDRNETRIYINSLLKENFQYKPYIIYHNTDSYKIIKRNIDLMINHDLFKKEFNEYPERLEFIDLRIIDQIRFKFTPKEELLERQRKELPEIKNDISTKETNE